MAETTEVEKGMSIFLDVFRRADKKDDGKISWEEFVAFFADGVMGKEELRALFEEIDTHKTNYIDPKELCDYFATHLGSFKEILSLIEDLNTKVSNVLVSTSQKYPASSRSQQFVTRFLMGLIMNQVSALQGPLDAATESLELQARESSSSIVPVQAGDVKEKKEGAIVPGRVMRRAKHQTSSQTSYEGSQGLASTRTALEDQVDRLASLVDRMEKRINLDGVVDEEVDVSNDQTVWLTQLDIKVKEGQDSAYRDALRSYIEATNAAKGCLSVTVRSFKDTRMYSMYEVWTNAVLKEVHNQTEKAKKFTGDIVALSDERIDSAVCLPASWWKRD
ncbi:N-terminal EF-hand calcium-binding protein 1-like [Mya arenaria]|uniref:N-terminal EF-hand calcium-binding protein 1-like n=1 Tax=Mya arenaria TaxID=6604 RepID=UPI0022E12E38|nr:N-terminal EF-hand calcium-binding protein 1-like [Mya arenaria]